MAYIGNEPGVSSQRVVSTFTATSGQTTFTPISGYTLGYIDVYLNGIKLVDGDDYTAANGMTVVLASGAAVGDSVECVAFFPRGLSDGYLKSEADARYVGLTGDQTIAGVKTFSGSATIVNGNLGVGTSSVLGNSTFNAALGIAVRNQSTSMGYFQTYNANAGSNLKTWRFGGDSSGNLVFETVNDAYSSATNRLTLDASGHLSLQNGKLFAWGNLDVAVGGDSSSEYLYFRTNATERARIDSSGNFGIGSTNPTNKLTVEGTSSNVVSMSMTNGTASQVNVMAFGGATGVGSHFNNRGGVWGWLGGGLDMVSVAGDLRFYTNGYSSGNERLRVNTSGQLMLGLTSPIAIPSGTVRFSASGNTAQYGTDGVSVGGRTFLRFGIAVNTTYTVTIALGDNVYALADIRVGVYCGAGSGKANAHFAYGGHTGAYHMNTVYNSFSGNITVGSPTISGSNIVFTVSVANAGSGGIAIIQVIDVNATTGYVSSISVA